ncbi:hypothetical protein [Sphaerisporangium fuscum]|uniref:hypothetical protein n=1 Tax=Sphaerisporangium fuscum TaxID=2835868 RepID=UPI001BDC8A2C|nr:hypothetical protein [Sphaerisporangium fuscum]
MSPANLVLREHKEARAALRKSRMFFRPPHYPDGRPIFIFGTGGNPAAHADALCTATDWICTPAPGARESLLEQARQQLAADRQQVLFTPGTRRRRRQLGRSPGPRQRWGSSRGSSGCTAHRRGSAWMRSGS